MRLFKLLFFLLLPNYYAYNPFIMRRELFMSFPLLTNLNLFPKIGEELNNPDLIDSEENNIYFYSEFNPQSCYKLYQKINELNHQSILFKQKYNLNPPPINLYLQSQGGSILHTLYISDLIKNLETPVYTYINGFSASAATIISVVGKKRFMSKNSVLLIHQLSGSESGKFNELKDEAENLDTLMRLISNIYLENTKINSYQLDKLLRRDIWLDANKSLELGFVDEII